MAFSSKAKVSSALISSMKIPPTYYQPYQPIFPFLRPQIPSSVTSDGMVSQETPTPKPRSRKRKSDKMDKSKPILKPDPANSEKMDLETRVAVKKQLNPNMMGGSSSREKRKAMVPLPVANSEDESSSSEESMDLGDFDTTGISKEEMKLWAKCAPQDQQLVKDFKREESPDHQNLRQRRHSGIFPDTISLSQIMPLMCL